MRRGWKAYYASLRDMILYLHKNDEQPAAIVIGDTNAIRLHHALAQVAVDYRKRQHVFRLKTSDWAEYLFQTSDQDLMNKWIEAINLIAASFSSPPLPAAIDSVSLRFQRPLLPSVQTRYSVVRLVEREPLPFTFNDRSSLQFEQYDFLLYQIKEITKQLDELRVQSYAHTNINGDIKQMKACDITENKDRITYLQYEVSSSALPGVRATPTPVFFASCNGMKRTQIDYVGIFSNCKSTVHRSSPTVKINSITVSSALSRHSRLLTVPTNPRWPTRRPLRQRA